MKLILQKFDLPLRHRFTISRESTDVQETLIASLSLNGKTGYGEATSNPYYKCSLAAMVQEIESIREALEAFPFTSPEIFYEFLKRKKLHHFTVCALDMAAHDLYGKLLGKPLYKLWKTTLHTYPTTNYTIGIASVEEMVAKMKEKPWPIYKIKLGTGEDVAIVRELRKHTESIFRIDANGAWTPVETIENAIILKKLGVEFIEQPLAATDWQGMEKVMHYSVLPIIADESCVGEDDVHKCSLHFSGINIKLCKCGGLTPALRMIRKGRELGLKIMVGCMTESTVGISAIAQLLPQLDYVDMDGAMLLAQDIANGVVIQDNAQVLFPQEAGCGVNLR